MVQKSTQPQFTLENVLRDPKAVRAYNQLISSGADPQKLWALLRVTTKTYEFSQNIDHLAVQGMTRRTLQNFPDQVREVAQSMELVSQNPHLATAKLDIMVEGLPAALRRYADGLSSTVQSFRRFMKRNPRYFDMSLVFRLKLLSYVRKTTGKPRYAWTADLLSGANYAFGLEKTEDPSNLRQLWKTHLKKTAHQNRVRSLAQKL